MPRTTTRARTMRPAYLLYFLTLTLAMSLTLNHGMSRPDPIAAALAASPIPEIFRLYGKISIVSKARSEALLKQAERTRLLTALQMTKRLLADSDHAITIMDVLSDLEAIQLSLNSFEPLEDPASLQTQLDALSRELARQLAPVQHVLKYITGQGDFMSRLQAMLTFYVPRYEILDENVSALEEVKLTQGLRGKSYLTRLTALCTKLEAELEVMESKMRDFEDDQERVLSMPQVEEYLGLVLDRATLRGKLEHSLDRLEKLSQMKAKPGLIELIQADIARAKIPCAQAVHSGEEAYRALYKCLDIVPDSPMEAL